MRSIIKTNPLARAAAAFVIGGLAVLVVYQPVVALLHALGSTPITSVALSLVVAVPAIAADCGTPTDLHDGWTVAAPEKEGLDPTLICVIGPRLEALKDAKAHGVVITRYGRLVYEHYFAGKDWRLTLPLGDVNFDATTKHDIRSISKSVTSLLVGIALDRGLT